MDESSLEQVHQAASILLARFLNPAHAAAWLEMARALKPRPEDYARVFVPEVANQARTGYAALWENLPAWPVRPDQTRLQVAVARAEDFKEKHDRAELFPGGYLGIAQHLQPGRIWVCWEFISPGRDAGVAFDGLVPINDRWAWFPKPWKVLPATRRESPLSHFSK
jgi:hypothetical protein